jgi:hypothetical protein
MLTFPLYVLQAQGRYSYKRESFVLAKEYMAEQDLEIIALATEIRENWNLEPGAGFLKHLVTLNRRVFAHLLSRSYDIKEQTRQIIREYGFQGRIQPAMESMSSKYLSQVIEKTMGS